MSTYRLSDRPKWWLPQLMKCMAILSAIVAVIMFLGSLFLEAFGTYTLREAADDKDFVAINLSYMADEVLWGSLGVLFYTAVFWMLSLAVDKIDQLVWLNATDEDREEILAKRKKKNAKN